MNDAAALEADLHRLIPLSAAMAVGVGHFDAETLVLTAPLEANRNHTGTGFAGSLYALASLAGWALLRGVFQRAGLEPALVLGEGRMRYLRPVGDDLMATASLEMAEQNALVQRLRQGRRVRGELVIPVPDMETAVYNGRFYATPATDWPTRSDHPL